MAIELRIPGVDLHEHFQARVEYHNTKVRDYVKRLDSYDETEGGLEYSEASNVNPRAQLRSRLSSHQTKGTYFALLAKYVDRSIVHDVGVRELTELELVDQLLG